jgi:AmmeMemoRadiSam system protein B
MKMNRKTYYFTLIPALIISAGVVFVKFFLPTAPISNGEKMTKPISSEIPLLPISLNPNPVLFNKAIQKFPLLTSPTTSEKKITGVILPHHDLASDLIAEVFQKLQVSQPAIKRFIIIGPNHPNKGSSLAITGNISWQLQSGSVESDEQGIESLLRYNEIGFDNNILSEEHSIFTIVPFVHYYYSGAKVVPLILNSTQTVQQSELLANYLKNLVDKDTVIIASVDFSHYLPSNITPQKDEITQAAMIQRDYEKIQKFNNDYIDSPPSIITFLSLMDSLSASNSTIVNHTNSGLLLGREIESSTSYFTIIFQQK